MTTPTQTRTGEHRAELLALIAVAADQLAAAWRLLPTAQDVLLRKLERIHPNSRGSIAATRNAIAVFNQSLAAYDRDARAVAERWAAQDLPRAYRDGAVRALHTVQLSAERFSWSTDHQAAITTLTAVYWADLIRRITEAVRRAQQFVRAAQAAARTSEGVDALTLLRDHPLDTVIYSNDARHPVAAWATSALNAQGIAAANHGAINLAHFDLDTQWLECVDGPECGFVSHQDTDHASGTIRSADDAATYPIAHPGCIRAWVPRPDLAGRTDIESGDPA